MNGLAIAARSLINDVSTISGGGGCGDCSSASVLAPRPASICRNAAMRYARKRAGSLSCSSRDSQATGCCRVVQPLGHEGGLAIAGRGADDGDFSVPRVQSAIEALDKVRPRDEVWPSHRDQQLGCQQRRRRGHRSHRSFLESRLNRFKESTIVWSIVARTATPTYFTLGHSSLCSSSSGQFRLPLQLSSRTALQWGKCRDGIHADALQLLSRIAGEQVSQQNRSPRSRR